MHNIIIHNHGTVNIFEIEDKISKAKDQLLHRMYYARNKDTLGGYDQWLKLLDLYYVGDYAAMKEYFQICRKTNTRGIVLKCLKIIMEG